jgi:hypothetical protein
VPSVLGVNGVFIFTGVRGVVAPIEIDAGHENHLLL